MWSIKGAYNAFCTSPSTSALCFLYLIFNPYAASGKFGQYKIMQKTWKMTETLAYEYSSESTQWELSNEYQHDRV